MNTKSVIALISIFFIQFVMSCRDECDCGHSGVYEVEYDGITVTPWNTAGFNATKVMDTVHRNAFGLTLSVNFEQYKISSLHNNFGLSAALACSCVPPEYYYTDPIDYAEVYVTDISTNEQQNATEHFGAYNYPDGSISLTDFFSIRQKEYEDRHLHPFLELQLELTEFEDVPSSAVFTVNVYLKSGTKFSEQTQQIKFHD